MIELLRFLCAAWLAAAAANTAPAPTVSSTVSAAPAVASTAAPADAVDPGAAAVLARFKAATGGSAWDDLRALRTQGTVETGGLTGRFETLEELGTGRGVGRFQLGPVSGAEGFDGALPWSQDPSGEVIVQRGEEALEASRNEAYRTSLAWWYPQRWPASLRLLPPQREGSRAFAVVEITPRGGRPFELWLDESSGLLERAVERGGVDVTTTTLGDWRPVEMVGTGATPGSILLPFLVRTTNGEPKYDIVLRAETVAVDPPVCDDDFAPPARRAGDFAIEDPSGRWSAPFILSNNHVYLQVFLDGQGPFRVLFDTGGFNLLTPEMAARLGLATQGALQARGVGEGSEDLAITHLREVRMGPLSLRDQVFYVLPLSGLSAGEGQAVAGVLGFEVLKRFVVEIDYRERRLTFTLPSRFDPARAGIAVPFVFAGHMPAVEGNIDGFPGRFTIDTGSRSAVSLHRPFVERHGLLARYRPGIEAVTGWGVGGAVRAKVTRAGNLRLGGVDVALPVAELVTSERGALSDRYVAGNVGGAILRRFRVTFDYGHERLYLAPGGDAGPDSFDRAGLWLVASGSELLVEDVIPGSPGASAGVVPGDRIEAVDGVLLARSDLDAVRGRLRTDPPGTTVRLRVRGQEGRRDLAVVLLELGPPEETSMVPPALPRPHPASDRAPPGY